MIGRLSLHAFKHDWIEYGAGFSMFLGLIGVVILLTHLQKWKWLWSQWLTSTDHKKIGIMYIVVSFVMLSKGLIDAGMMRAQQAFAVGECAGYLTPSHYQQIFTAHGVTMIFFVGMGVTFGLMNLLIPLQIGARDVAFPFLNSLSFWLFSSGSLFILVSLVIGVFAGTGWTAYPPLSGLEYSPGVGVDYWLWSVQISGVGTLLSGINFLVTILKMRCPGMSLMKMPVFVWSSLATVILVIFAFPILTATASMLTTDRLVGTHFFTSDLGGNPMMYVNLIWAWGHPEVYILILPAFGAFSEIVAVFCKKKLFGYTSMVAALMGIAFLSFLVWLHHFFTMGAGANVNAFFGIMTMVIAIPTGVKVFNWLFTMYRGKVHFTTPMLWFLGFIVTFTLGGMAGVLMAIPAVDFQLHNSLFLVAHFHTVIIGGVLFGFFAAYSYWFPKFTGFKLNESLGKAAFWCWIIGFFIAFMPLYALGLMGATRRISHYSNLEWQPLFIVAGAGAVIMLAGFALQVIQLYVSIQQKDQNQDETGDPWDGRTLEWMTSSPPPFYNFATLPTVHEKDAFWQMKRQLVKQDVSHYEPFHMPHHSALGPVIGVLSFLLGFAMIWYLFWVAAITALLIIGTLCIRFYTQEVERTVSVKEIIATEATREKML